jgi:acetyl-CoA carboxylase biotin carboxylase subunit
VFRTLVRNTDVQNGQYDIHWLEGFLEREGLSETDPKR